MILEYSSKLSSVEEFETILNDPEFKRDVEEGFIARMEAAGYKRKENS